MWKISDVFKDTLRGEHQQAVRITFLNAFMQQVSELGQIDSCFCLDDSRDVTDFVSDGNVDIDVDRIIRRTAGLTILNPSGRFTPRRSKDIDTDDDGDPNSTLVGYVYLNRYVRIERGVHINSKQHLYAPVGTFMIDVAEIISERNMTVVNLTLSDLGKKLVKSVFTESKTYENDFYYDIIESIVKQAGIKESEIERIDKLEGRKVDEKKFKGKLKFEQGESRGERLKELCDKWDIDIYFNPMGKLVTEDRRSDKDKVPQWHFSTVPGNGDGMTVTITRSLSDDNLFNHLIVVGSKDEKNLIVRERINDNKNSKTSVQRIGDRAKYIETDKIGDVDGVMKLLNRQWERRLSFEETLSLTTICMPALEGNDVITVYDPKTRIYDKKNNNKGKRYRIKRFNVPLVTSKQDIELVDTVSMDEL